VKEVRWCGVPLTSKVEQVVGSLVLLAMSLSVGCSDAEPDKRAIPTPAAQELDSQASDEDENELATASRPNVLFIGIDDLRPELGCYGSAVAQTPHIDKLAEQSLRFDRAYCQVSLCNPSRASLMTGCRPMTTGVIDLKTHFRTAMPDVMTLPQAFKSAGYRSWSLGKIYHGNLLDPPSWTDEPFIPERGLIYALNENREVHKPRKKGPPTERAEVDDATYRDGLITERAIELLASAGEEPFFLALGYFKPHLPLAAPATYWERHSLESISLATMTDAPEGAPRPSRKESGELRQYLGVPTAGPIADAMAREIIHGYHACVSYVDAQVGRVMQALEDNGLDQNTIVVLWSDHGWYLGEHGLWAKMGVRELGLRMPLMVRAPGQARTGVDSEAIVELVDIYPTLCELAQLPLPAHLEGDSFAKLLDAEESDVHRLAFSEHHAPNERAFSVRSQRWRFNFWIAATGGEELGEELYDLGMDPLERVNVAALSEHREIIDELRSAMKSAWPGVFSD
jgi:iduronate 2-sulfatase